MKGPPVNLVSQSSSPDTIGSGSAKLAPKAISNPAI